MPNADASTHVDVVVRSNDCNCNCNCNNFVYILRSEAARRTYVGATKNPRRRLRQHNGEISGGARATRGHRPWRCVAVVGDIASWSDALKLEWRLKRASRGRRGADRCDVLVDVLRMSRWTRTATPMSKMGALTVLWSAADAPAVLAATRAADATPHATHRVVPTPEAGADADASAEAME